MAGSTGVTVRPVDMGFIQPPPGNTGYRDGNRKGRDGIRDYMRII